jgi:hypothetical protein
MNKRTRSRLLAVAVVLVIALVGGGLVLRDALQGGTQKAAGPPCQVGTFGLDLEQATNATTIAAIGKRLGMPDHAVSIALATALLESNLHNLRHGDRDSLGLFQQRPSQGWGTAAQILTPHYAAANFYEHLALVPGWQVIPVTDAAQRVQRSALPNGYAHYEPKARALAEALTGEVPARFTCRVDVPATPPTPGALTTAMITEMGVRSLPVDLPTGRGWTVASWLVGHAAPFRITSVAYAGQRWTATQGRWIPDPSVGSQVEIVRQPSVASNSAAPRSPERTAPSM